MLDKAYDPKAVEDRIYKMWEQSGAFTADASSSKTPFTISMPPPNATGTLHLGHASMLALQDIFIRFNRMNGKEALWLPGTDHAAIATESVVIKQLQKEGMKNPREALGREALVAKIAEFVEQSRGTIRSQVRKMGSSCDWSRERYTLDPMLNRCVNEVFSEMHKDGLMYRGQRVVNWDTALQTTISDDEIEHEDREATLYTIEYLTAEQTGGEPVYVATSRPETKLGDTGLVVHPDDERYKHLIGKRFTVTWPGGQTIEVGVIAEHTVDPAFGTGVLGLTPFHSKIDEEMWLRHKDELPYPIHVINEQGKMTEHIKGYEGLSVAKAREQFVAELKAAGRILKEETYTRPTSISYRSKKPVEPLPKLQWFIDVNKKVIPWKGSVLSLKEVMQDTVRSGMIRFIPERFEKTYFQWIDNLQDWCVSRQIWWGHRIPVWYKGDEMQVSSEAPGKEWTQDNDTLDTWFSSALWTWSTLIDPSLLKNESLSLPDLLRKSPDFQKFHPTDILETAADILFFWVARMILMTTYTLGKLPELSEEQRIPFKTVYLHGLVLTREGKKMSKSNPESAIDPLEIIPQYGADALRLSMIVGQSPGNNAALYEEKIAGYRNFVNKLWNASRFVLMQCEKEGFDPKSEMRSMKSETLSLADRAILSRLQQTIEKTTKGLDEYRLSEVGETLYSFVWNDVCDWYLELSKGNANTAVLVHVLRSILQMLHPLCPFVTEELWSEVKPTGSGMLILETWPTVEKKLHDTEAEEAFAMIVSTISELRRIRSEQNVEPGKGISVTMVTKELTGLLEDQQEHIKRMAHVDSLTIQNKKFDGGEAATAFLSDLEIHVPLAGLIDLEKERERIEGEIDNLEGFVKGINQKLKNKQFVDKAPEAVVAVEREKLATAEEKLKKLKERMKSL